ncbi:MAG: prolyl oligopeptidase family serine peptidase [Chitinispirillaceae bacterium]|nr:prolyl oligopeptidase family serine peptidase [Chitinispirillaceae bacterium]
MLRTIQGMIVVFLLCGILQAQNESIVVNGETRTFITHAPSETSSLALVISMHGLSGTGAQQRSMSGFDKIADREKFVVVYPDGSDNRWDISGTTDVDFILAIIDTMAARYAIDRNRVYATGFSMGGMMSYKLACSAADRFAAIGPASGYLFGGARGCTPSRPMPILHIHGSVDTVVDYSGLASYIDGWVEKNGCSATAEITKPYPESKPGSKVTKEYYGQGEQGSEVIVLTVEGMGHAYPGSFGSQDINASEEFWAFFKKHVAGQSGINGRRSSLSITQPVSARYQGGMVAIRSGAPLQSVLLCDLQGKVVHSWRTGTAPVHTLSLQVSGVARGMYTLRITDSRHETLLRVAVP